MFKFYQNFIFFLRRIRAFCYHVHMNAMKKVIAQGLSIHTFVQNDGDYISLTDIARYRDQERSDYIIQNWIRNTDTIEFLGIWEQLNNPNFKSIEFDGLKGEAGSNSFSLTPKKWVEIR